MAPLAIFVQDGNAIDYVPTTDVAAGDVVVQGELVGVTRMPIKASELGSLAVAGVFDVAKATGAGTAIAVGTNVYWNATANQATATATGNKLIGKSIKASTVDDATVRIRLFQ